MNPRLIDWIPLGATGELSLRPCQLGSKVSTAQPDVETLNSRQKQLKGNPAIVFDLGSALWLQLWLRSTKGDEGYH